MAKIFQNRGGTLTPILDTDNFVNIGNVNQTNIQGTKTFTGTINVPDQTVGDYSQKAANTKFVQDTVTNLISCREEVYQVTSPISSGSTVTIPSGVKYITGSNMLEVSYNGLVEYKGEQYNETGTQGQESGTITILHNMEVGDTLVFRVNGLCDADSVSDAVHITGTETIDGAKTFTVSPSVPNLQTTDNSTKAANTKFVHDLIDGFSSCQDEVLVVSSATAAGSTITLPAGMQYISGANMMLVSYNGYICYPGEQYNETGAIGSLSSTIEILFDLKVGDSLGFRISSFGGGQEAQLVVHKSGTETISGEKTFTVSPKVPTVADETDSSTKAASTEFVQNVLGGAMTCLDEVVDISTAQASGSIITLPQGMQYVVGSSALMVSYNGAVCHIGEQFNEYGTAGQQSNQIQILFDLSVGDQLGFRMQGLSRIDTSSADLVHKTGSETISGTKTFTTSPVLPTIATTTNNNSAASTKFVHDIVDGYMTCYDDVLTVSSAVSSGNNVTLPGGIQYVVGSHMLMVSYNGTVCHVGEQFNEVGTTGQLSSTIQVLFDLRVGDKLGVRIHGISDLSEIPYDVVHTTNAETISGTKSFNSSPVVIPDLSLGDYSNKVVTSKWVKDLCTTPVYVDSVNGSDSNSGLSAAESVATIGKGLEILYSIPNSSGFFVRLVIQAGTYNENVNIHNLSCEIHLYGNVSINGGIYIKRSNIDLQQKSSGTLTVTKDGDTAIFITNHSDVWYRCPTNIVSSNASTAIYVHYNSFALIEGSDLDITANSVANVIRISTQSHAAITAPVNIHGTSIARALLVNEEGYGFFNNNFVVSSETTGDCITVDGISYLWMVNCNTITLTGNKMLYVAQLSFCCISNVVNFTMNRSSSSDLVTAASFSKIYITGGTIKLNINCGTATTGACFWSTDGSYIALTGKQTITYSGKCNINFSAAQRSYVYIDSQITFAGSVTAQRYTVNTQSCINTSGQGANRCPGSTAGTSDSSKYAVYM